MFVKLCCCEDPKNVFGTCHKFMPKSDMGEVYTLLSPLMNRLPSLSLMLMLCSCLFDLIYWFHKQVTHSSYLARFSTTVIRNVPRYSSSKFKHRRADTAFTCILSTTCRQAAFSTTVNSEPLVSRRGVCNSVGQKTLSLPPTWLSWSSVIARVNADGWTAFLPWLQAVNITLCIVELVAR